MKCSFNKPFILGIVVLFMATAVPVNASQVWTISKLDEWLQGEFDGTGLTSRDRILPTMSVDGYDIPARIAWDAEAVPDRETTYLIGTSLPSRLIIHDGSSTETIRRTQGVGFTAIAEFNGSLYAAESPSGSLFKLDSNTDTAVQVATVSDSYIWSLTPGPNGDNLYLGSGPSGTLYRMSQDETVDTVATLPGNNIMDITIFQEKVYIGDDYGGLYRISDNQSPNSIYGFKHGEIASITSDSQYLYVAVNKQQSRNGNGGNSGKNRSELAKQLRERHSQRQTRRRIQQELQTQAVDDTKTNTDSAPGVNESLPSSPASGSTEKDLDSVFAPDILSEQASTQRPTMIEEIRKATSNQSSNLFQGLSGTLVYRMSPPGQMNVFYNDQQEIVQDMKASDGNLFIATGGTGRLYKISSDFTRTAYLNTDQKLLTSVQLKEGQPHLVTTGEGASVYRRQPFSPDKATYRSAPMDAQLLSQWGSFEISNQGPVSVRTRSGNSHNPEQNWTSWSSWEQTSRTDILSPAGRYLQFELRFESPESSVNNAQIAYKLPNQRPRIVETKISGQDRRPSQSPFKKSKAKKRAQSGNGSKRVPARHQIQWKAVDPDGDQLIYKLLYRPEGATRWISLTDGQPIKQSGYTWDTTEFSEGWYKMKLIVSDRRTNPPSHAFSAETVFGPVLIDHQSPDIQNPSVDNAQLQFVALDETSWIDSAHYRINGQDWIPIEPEDGILDERRETFSVTLSELLESDDILEVRVSDEKGNSRMVRTPF